MMCVLREGNYYAKKQMREELRIALKNTMLFNVFIFIHKTYEKPNDKIC